MDLFCRGIDIGENINSEVKVGWLRYRSASKVSYGKEDIIKFRRNFNKSIIKIIVLYDLERFHSYMVVEC